LGGTEERFGMGSWSQLLKALSSSVALGISLPTSVSFEDKYFRVIGIIKLI
jgi:hypothetical protein